LAPILVLPIQGISLLFFQMKYQHLVQMNYNNNCKGFKLR